MISIQVDTLDPEIEREIAEAIETMLGLLPTQTVVSTAPQAANIVQVFSDDGPYTMLFSVPDGFDPLKAQEMVNDLVGNFYADSLDSGDPVGDMIVELEKHGIVLANLYEVENSF